MALGHTPDLGSGALLRNDDRMGETEVISLTLPHDQRFVSVARIVVGGLAARLDLPFESLDDLQLAVEAVLSEERYIAADEVTVEVAVQGRLVRLFIAPLQTDALEADLERDDESLGLRVLLAAVVDSVGFEGRPDGERWLCLEKQVPRPAGS